jgi:hypothetical protein
MDDSPLPSALAYSLNCRAATLTCQPPGAGHVCTQLCLFGPLDAGAHVDPASVDGRASLGEGFIEL